jgi:TRAP-type C4-dicarboxylate transport system permease small subunit
MTTVPKRRRLESPFFSALDAFDAIIRVLVKISEIATVLIAFFITGSMIVGVFFRFVLNSSVGWTDEVSSLLLAVMMFLVIGIGVHQRLHIGVAVLIERLPFRGQQLLDVALHLVSAAFFALVAVEGVKVAQSGMGITLATVELPRGLFFLAIPIGSGFAALTCINNVFRVLRGRDHPRFGGID